MNADLVTKDLKRFEWKAKTLKRVGALKGGSGFPLDEQGFSEDEMELPFFKVKDLSSPKYLRETDNYVSGETAQKLGASIFRVGTIVFAKVGAALLLNRFRQLACDGCIDNNMMALELEQTHSKDFFLHFLNTLDLSRNFNQGPVPSVNTRQIGEINVVVPPFADQNLIAAYLDASCDVLNTVLEAKRRQLETLDALRKDVIQQVVTRGLSKQPKLRKTGNIWMEEVPIGWDLVCLKRVSELQGGLTLGKTYEGPLVERPYLRVANVQDGHLDLDDVTMIEVPAEVAKRVELRIDDVLMTEGGDLDKLARGYLWKGEIPDCLHQNHIFAVRCFHHKLLPKFLTYLTASRYGRDYFEATGKKTTNLASTNSTKVGAFPLPLPPVKEQARLVEYLEEQLESLRTLQNNLQTQIETLLAYRKSLIHECVTGQKRITEADVKHLTMTTN